MWIVWASISGWLTPTFLFLLLNVVVGTIAITSHKSYKSHHQELQQQQQLHHHLFPRALSRGASMLTRLRSFNLNQYRHVFDDAAAETTAVSHPPSATGVVREEEEEESRKKEAKPEKKDVREEEKAEKKDIVQEEGVVETLEDAYRNFKRMPTAPAGRALGRGAAPSVRKAAIERAAKKKMKAEEEEQEEEETRKEVDVRADDFINRFRKTLQLQRLESLLRRKEQQR